MINKNFLLLILTFCIAVSCVLMFGIHVKAVDTAMLVPDTVQPDAISIEELNIIANYAVLQGETIQMQVEDFSEYVLFDSVEWSSSRPDIISCTKNGEIKGLKEGKATITVKAKIGNATDSITVFCAKKLNNIYPSQIGIPFGWTCKTPSFLHIQEFHYSIIPFLPIFNTEKMNVKGVYDSYFYVEFERNEKRFKGFIPQNWMPANIASGEIFKQLSKYDLDVFVNFKKDSYKITTKYKGAVKWTVSDTNIIDFNDETGEVLGLRPGIATISATVGDKTLVCTVHSIYRWPLDWTGAARQSTCVYSAKGNTFEKTATKLLVGDTFYVKGDMGSNSSWAYGVSGSGTWGYIPINHLSTKGTISQYNNMKTTLEDGETVPWIWPVRDVKDGISQSTRARYISSPYGWRDDNPVKHKGIDITNGISSKYNLAKSADGYEVVSAFAGKVIYVYDISSGYKSCGNCVAIRSNEKDPITGKYFVAIYMHLKSKPNVNRNQEVSANTLLGYVGDTGNSGGSHLHFEVNNQNLSYGQTIYYENDSEKEMVFGSVINPLFFYMDYYNLPEDNSYKVVINPTCAAMNYRMPLWYGDDIKESKNP